MNRTTDRQYADLLASLNAIPAPRPVKREATRQQERERLAEDLMAANGEATW